MGWKLRIANAGLMSAVTFGSLVVGAQNEAPVQIGICHNEARCAANADTTHARSQMIAEQVARFTCQPWTKGDGFPRSALIRESTTLAHGVNLSGVVEQEPYAEAWSEAKSGQAWIVRWCR